MENWKASSAERKMFLRLHGEQEREREASSMKIIRFCCLLSSEIFSHSMLLSDNYAIHLKARKITSKHQHTLERAHTSGKFSCGEILTKTECGWLVGCWMLVEWSLFYRVCTNNSTVYMLCLCYCVHIIQGLISNKKAFSPDSHAFRCGIYGEGGKVALVLHTFFFFFSLISLRRELNTNLCRRKLSDGSALGWNDAWSFSRKIDFNFGDFMNEDYLKLEFKREKWIWKLAIYKNLRIKSWNWINILIRNYLIWALEISTKFLEWELIKRKLIDSN